MSRTFRNRTSWAAFTKEIYYEGQLIECYIGVGFSGKPLRWSFPLEKSVLDWHISTDKLPKLPCDKKASHKRLRAAQKRALKLEEYDCPLESYTPYFEDCS